MTWIKCSDNLPPKDKKFLFSYYYGIGLGYWSQGYTTINGNSERTHKSYFLILDPRDPSEGDLVFEWDEKQMIEMEVSWMLLPNPPNT